MRARRVVHLAWALVTAMWFAVASAAPSAQAPSAWLYGERHDHPDHAAQVAEAIRGLARASRLRAVVLEMAERGRHTADVPPDASEATVRQALAWQDAGWPWAQYGPLVMAAVRAGVPVVGGNLPRGELRTVMADAQWDERVPPEVRERLIDAVREGHCDLLPASQLGPMARVQIARDEQMARTVAEAAEGAVPGQVVVLHAGAAHVSRRTGVPVHLARLAPQLQLRVIGFDSAYVSQAEPGFDEWRPARHVPPRDHCAELRQRGMAPRASPETLPAASGPASAPASR